MGDLTYADSKTVLNAIKVLEQHERDGTLTPEGKRALERARASQPAATEEVDATNARYRGAVQGITLSARDELAGAKDWLTNGMTVGAYVSGRDASRAKDHAAMAAYPEDYSRGKVAGNISSMAFPAGGSMKMTKGMGLLGKMLWSGVTGGTTAGFDGFMSGEGWGDSFNRAMTPAAVGTVVGLLAPVAGMGAGKLTRALQDRGRAIPGFGPRATGKVARTMNARRLADAADIEDYLAKLGPEGMYADVPGAPRKLAQGIAAMPGKGGDVLQDAIETRASKAGERIANDVEDVMGPADAAFDTRKAQAAARTGKWGPDYDAALAHKEPINIDDLANTLSKAQFDEATQVKNAIKRVERDLGIKVNKVDGATVVEVPEISATRLHNARVSLRDAVDAAQRAGNGGLAKKLGTVLDELDAKLDNIPNYAATRAGYADSKAMDRATEAGRKAFSGSTETAIPLRELKKQWATMTDAQKDAYRKGAREWLDALMGTSRNDAAAAWGAFEKGWNDEKLRFLFGDDEAGKILNRLYAEKTFSKTRGKILEGSDTRFGAEATRTLGDVRDPDYSVGVRGPVGRAKDALNEVGNEVFDTFRYGQRRAVDNEEIGRILSLQGEARDEAVRGLLAEALYLGRKTKAQGATEGLLDFILRAGGTGLVAGVTP